MTVVVFGRCAPRDEALANSRWIAARHLSRFGAEAVAVVDEQATRAGLEAALAEPAVEGVVLCGHGDGGKAVFCLHNQHHDRDEAWRRRYEDTSEHGAVYGSDDEPALDHDNAALTKGRWVHILACELGLSEIPERACQRDAVAVASYEQRLVPEFTVSSLPEPAAAILGRIVTTTTAGLAAREFGEVVLAGHVRRAGEELLDWFDSDEGGAWTQGPGMSERMGLTKFVMQLSSALRVIRREPNAWEVILEEDPFGDVNAGR